MRRPPEKRWLTPVGMTSAALYRHFENKQAMFAALVQPAVDALEAWKQRHIASSYQVLEQDHPEIMWEYEGDLSDAGMVLDLMYQQPETFRLLLCRAAGTPYEKYIHDLIEQSCDQMMLFYRAAKRAGFLCGRCNGMKCTCWSAPIFPR